jgi:hypothetical protein
MYSILDIIIAPFLIDMMTHLGFNGNAATTGKHLASAGAFLCHF